MTGGRSEFPWSDVQIQKALARRALPYYSDEELAILRDLAVVGAAHIRARRAGGQKPKSSAARGIIRRILIEAIYPGLSSRLRKTPTGAATIARICDLLSEKYGFAASEETVLKDVRKIGTRKLRRK